MSIWTELLVFHGYVATPRALSLIADVLRPPVEPGEPDAPELPEARIIERPPLVVHHPLRVIGQLP